MLHLKISFVSEISIMKKLKYEKIEKLIVHVKKS